MDYQILTPELRDDPENIGYAGMSDDAAAAALNLRTRTRTVTTFATWRKMLADLGPTVTATVKAKVEAAAEANPAVALALDMLSEYGDGGGLDIGHANTRAVIDSLAAGGVLTLDESTAIKAMAEQPCSRADELGLPAIDAAHVQSARQQPSAIEQADSADPTDPTDLP